MRSSWVGAQAATRRRLTFGVAAVALSLAAGLAPGDALAKTFKVTTARDPTPDGCRASRCSLREAVLAANARAGRDRIELRSHKRTYQLAIPGTTEDLAMTGDLDVSGPLTVFHRGKGRAHIDGGDLDRIFEVLPDAPTSFKRLLLTGGQPELSGDGGAVRGDSRIKFSATVVRGNSAPDAGGGIYSSGTSDLVILDSKLKGNSSGDGSGAFEALGPTALIKNTTVRSNSTPGEGGSSYLSTDARVVGSSFSLNQAGNRGGALYLNDGRLLIKRSSFAGNSTDDTGGAVMSFGELVVDSSTFSSNVAKLTGGGIHAGNPGTVQITNSTLAGNRAGSSGGGLHTQQVPDARLNAVTIARNVANTDSTPFSETGGGISNIDSSVYIRNSLIALNTLGPGVGNDCTGTLLFSQGNNLLSTLGPAAVCNGFGAGDLIAANPKIRALGDYGGPTETVALRKGSPAVGAADRPSSPSRDQRGTRRDNRPDIGAYER